MSIWYFGSPELPDKVLPIIDRAREVGSIVAGVAIEATRRSLEFQATVNPLAKRILDACFEPPMPDPTDALAEAQYPQRGGNQ